MKEGVNQKEFLISLSRFRVLRVFRGENFCESCWM